MRWLHAPGHAGSIGPEVIKFAFNLRPLVVDWSEMYWNTDDLKLAETGYQHYIGPVVRFDSRKRPVGHDVVVSVHKDAKIIHTESFFVSGEVRQLIKYFPERHGKAVVFEWEGVRVLGIFWHPHPNPFRRINLVLPKYERGVHRVQAVQSRLEERFKPDVVLNGGDLQLGEGSQFVHPNMYASRNKMHYRRHRIDWQMWKGAKFVFDSFVRIDPAKINKGMDHMWTMLRILRDS